MMVCLCASVRMIEDRRIDGKKERRSKWMKGERKRTTPLAIGGLPSFFFGPFPLFILTLTRAQRQKQEVSLLCSRFAAKDVRTFPFFGGKVFGVWVIFCVAVCGHQCAPSIVCDLLLGMGETHGQSNYQDICETKRRSSI